MVNLIGYLVVCGVGILCVAWWWWKMRETAWIYTIYVAVILWLTHFVVLR